MRMMKLPAGNSREADSVSFSFSFASLAPSFLEDFFGFFAGKAMVKGEVAREISTCCFWSTWSNSVCSSRRESSAGGTYRAGPSLVGFPLALLLLPLTFLHHDILV